eukprot:g35197.t1
MVTDEYIRPPSACLLFWKPTEGKSRSSIKEARALVLIAPHETNFLLQRRSLLPSAMSLHFFTPTMMHDQSDLLSNRALAVGMGRYNHLQHQTFADLHTQLTVFGMSLFFQGRKESVQRFLGFCPKPAGEDEAKRWERLQDHDVHCHGYLNLDHALKFLN